jgi:DNA repair protein RecO (recombination protein O)
MLTNSQAIVLHAFKYGESKLIVDLFTRQSGRLSFIVGLPKTQKGRLKKQFFQSLSLLEAEYDERPKVQLQKLKDVRLSLPFVSIPYDASKLSISLFLAEFLYHALKGEQQNQPLFDYVWYSIAWLDGRTDSVANFHLVFLMHMSRFLGFFPNLENFREGCYFDLRAAAFCAEVPVHRDFLLPEEASRVEMLMRMDYPTMHLFRMSRQDRRRLLEVALLYYRLHLPDFPELKSLAVLEEVFNE